MENHISTKYYFMRIKICDHNETVKLNNCVVNKRNFCTHSSQSS